MDAANNSEAWDLLHQERAAHERTKRELEALQEEFDSFRDGIQQLVESRIAEIKGIHAAEKEHLANRVQLSQIKLQNLQFQFDDLLQRTLEKEALPQDQQEGEPLGSGRVMQELMRSQEKNDRLMGQFLAEMRQLKSSVIDEVRNCTLEGCSVV
jgi:hypothetical protein